MEDRNIQELSEVIQSSNLNFLLGAGISLPFLPILGNIEKDLNEAKNESEREVQFKKYLTQVILPNIRLLKKTLSSDENEKYEKTSEAYKNFFHALTEVLLKRKNTILSKQINLFSTNIDILIESILEGLQIEYNDGFSGKFTPLFSLANFKKSIYQRSLHYDHISEIPVFNVIKIHGSLTWKNNEQADKIIFSHSLEHIDEAIISKTKAEFTKAYKKILVVNPEEAKHLESVLNLYYSELLRMYSSELEKENAALFVIGFSMEDKHIKEITLRAAKSNPTLRIFIFCSQTSKVAMEKKMELEQHPNIQIFTPDDSTAKFTLDYLNETVLKKLNFKRS
jgi:hypothetical protein